MWTVGEDDVGFREERLMPTPTKFRQAARDRALAVLNAGGSRRAAAKAAGIDHATLHRWIRRGERATSESRSGRFADAVKRAEADPKTPVALPEIDDGPSDAEVRWALKFLERTEPGWAPPTAEALKRDTER
jgi:transposase